MKKQVILGLAVMISLLVLVSSAAAHNITIVEPEDNDTVVGNITINATTLTSCDYVNFSWSLDNLTWFDVDIGYNETNGTNFTIFWNTSELCTGGNYTINASTNQNASYTMNSSYLNVTIDNDVIELVTPAAGATISGNYTFSATTTATRAYVNFSWSNDSGGNWTVFGNNSTSGTEFTFVFETETNLSDGTYWFNATSNCTINDERTETDENQGVIVRNAVAAVVDSPEFSTIMVAGLIGLLSATAILMRKKKE